MEQMRIVKEMRERERANGRTGWMVRPRYMVWENVPGAFSSGNPKGADFAAVIEEIIKVAEPGTSVSVCIPNGGWTKSGCYYAEDGSWSLAWRVHDAQFWGVPQRRKRIALVADFGGLSAPEILFERKGLSRDSEPCGAQREEAAGAVGGGVASTSGAMNPWDSQVTDYTALCVGNGQANQSVSDKAGALNTMHDQQAVMVQEIAHTLKAKANCDFREDSETYPVTHQTVRRLTHLECERLQGYPDGWTNIGEWVDSKGKKHGEADSPRCDNCKKRPNCPERCFPKMDYERGRKKIRRNGKHEKINRQNPRGRGEGAGGDEQ